MEAQLSIPESGLWSPRIGAPVRPVDEKSEAFSKNLKKNKEMEQPNRNRKLA
jgi:hypothetical protein